MQKVTGSFYILGFWSVSIWSDSDTDQDKNKDPPPIKNVLDPPHND